MTDVQRRFVELERRKDEIKQYYEDLAQATLDLSKEIGVNGLFQDDQGIVYKVVVPEGKFVHYETLSYVRTRRAHEARGDLSMKEAEGAGFTLPQR